MTGLIAGCKSGRFMENGAPRRTRVMSSALRPIMEGLEQRLVMAVTLPAGFAQAPVTSGFGEPTDMVPTPDGRVFITEKTGAVRVYKNGALRSTPFITLNVDSYRDRGLDAIALDPNFTSNGFVYLYYTKADPANPNTAPNNAVNRLSRVTADPANLDVVKAGSEVVLLDNIPSNTGYHIGGLLEFGPDGKIYLGTGDGGVAFDAQNSGVPSYAQDLNSLGGKVLRLNPDGTAPADNPYFGQTGKRAEVWASGLRNPFSGAVDPVTGKVFANDVGQADWEEVNSITRGGNFGWPGAEGNSTNPAYINPLYTYAHDPNLTYSASVTGGMFYRGSTFPASYTGQYFVSDYIQGWIKVLNPTTGAATPFASGASGPIRIEATSDGGFLYLSHGDHAIYKVSYVGSANRAPSAVASATPTSGLAPLTVTFDATGSSDPDGDTLTYTWNFGDGTTGSGRTVSKTYTTNGAFTATVTVSDGRLSTSANAPVVNVGAVAPTPIITLPANNTPYTAGDRISFAGSATDPLDGTLPASAFNWAVIFHHETHTHGFIDSIPGVKSGSFVIPTEGETAPVQWYEIKLTVTNSKGLTSTTSVNVNPRLVTLSLATNVPGLKVNLDGQPVTTPNSQQAVAGLVRGLGAPLQQVLNGVAYNFASWSDGGAANHNISTPATNVTYTATYVAASGPTPYSGTPMTVPGLIKLSDYDLGGQGIAFNDTTTANEGDAATYRPSEGVDLEYSADLGAPLNLGWIEAGEWINYTVNVAVAGTYNARVRVASIGAGGRFRLEFNGAQIGSPFAIPDTGGWQTYRSLHLTGITLPKGQGVLRLVCEAAGASGFAGNIASLALTTSFKAVGIPNRLEAEDFDNGGEGAGFSDSDVANLGGGYRSTAVDIESTGDAGGGYNVGYMSVGEWLEYTFTAAAADTYALAPRVASLGAGGTFQLTVDGLPVGGVTTIPDTGGWQTYQSVPLTATALSAGTHIARFTVVSAGGSGFAGNLNYIDVAGTTTLPPPPPPPGTTQSPYNGTSWPAPGQIEAENFDNGGEGVAYHDIDGVNVGGVYRTSGVDVENSPDVGGGYAVGHISAGEWLEYTLNVATAGLHNLDVRFASGSGGGNAHVEIDGVQVGGSITLGNTGGWTTWTTITATGLNLPAGQHVLRFAFDTTAGGEIGVLNWLKLSSTAVPPPPPAATVPAAPTSLAATVVSSTRVDLVWTSGSTNETGFKVERRLGTAGTWAQIGTTGKGVTSYGDTSGVSSANYNYRVRATNAVGDSAYSNIAAATTLTDATQSPFSSTPIAMPGTIQAEAFDNGGQGIAFNDTTTSNLGGKYRTTAVDIESTTDTGGGFVVSSTAVGEWLEYTVNVPTSGWFTLDARVSAKGSAGRFHVEADRVNITGTLAAPNTGAWTTYRTVTSTAFALSAGTHVLRLAVDAAASSGRGPNINWLRLNATATPASAATSSTTLKSIAALAAGEDATAITALRLVDARTGVPIDGIPALSDGISINLAALTTRRIAIRAEFGGTDVHRLLFSLDGKRRYRLDKHPTIATRVAPWKLKPGEHTVVATAFEKLGGELGSLTVRFIVINTPVGT